MKKSRSAWNKNLHIDLSHGKGQFKKGHIPWNKGLHIDLSHGKGHFTKGTVPPLTRPVGSIRLQKDGYTYIKIASPNKWQLYQRYLYEKYHKCKLKKNETVIFLDGNKQNFSIDNLMKITRRELAIFNHQGLQTKGNTELSKTGALIAKLKVKIKEVK